MSEPQANVSSRRRIPAIWIVPVVAGLLGIYMVIYTAMTEGPTITITFATAEGIEEAKTKIKSRNVEVGVVEEVHLNPDLESVTVQAKLDKAATPLLRDDTRFWVVRPRFGAAGITGLGTILSGGYIELEPGLEAPSAKRDFQGLDDIPLTPVDTPGLKFVLVSSRAGGVGPGDPVLYHGFEVGKIEESIFDPRTERVRHTGFIQAPYDELVDRATRFWNASGIALDAGADGVKLRVGSLRSLVTGGVAFAVPDGFAEVGPVEDGVEFDLYESYDAALERGNLHSIEYVVAFTQSLRGLVPGAPVEYRGIRVGTVRGILIEQIQVRATEGEHGSPIPILISLEPARIAGEDTQAALERTRKNLAGGVEAGMRASLQSGNLLTGALYVSLDYYDDVPQESMGEIAGYPSIPTVSTGLQRIERQVSTMLTKINDLPLEVTVAELNRNLRAVRRTLESDSVQQLPASLEQTLLEVENALQSLSPDSATIQELNQTLREVQALSRTLNEQPSSIIYSKPVRPDPEPGEAR